MAATLRQAFQRARDATGRHASFRHFHDAASRYFLAQAHAGFYFGHYHAGRRGGRGGESSLYATPPIDAAELYAIIARRWARHDRQRQAPQTFYSSQCKEPGHAALRATRMMATHV